MIDRSTKPSSRRSCFTRLMTTPKLATTRKAWPNSIVNRTAEVVVVAIVAGRVINLAAVDGHDPILRTSLPHARLAFERIARPDGLR